MEELSYKGDNPGAVQYGNFINYYQFHPPSNRIAMLPSNIWGPVVKDAKKCQILDVGCNVGDLTSALYEFFTHTINVKDCYILGIDIDPILIQRASEKNTFENVTFKCLDIMAENSSFEQYLSPQKNNKFNIVFCFSITMWIHLNHGDDGLKQFLKKVSQLSNCLVIEPQPWKCYKTAVKRFKLGKSEFPKFPQLRIRQNIEEEIEHFISKDCGFKKIHESDRTKWGRKLLFFKRVND